MRRLFLAESIIDTLKFGASLYCLTYIGYHAHDDDDDECNDDDDDYDDASGSWLNLLILSSLAGVIMFIIMTMCP